MCVSVSVLQLFNKIPDTRVSCLIASSGFPYYWSDSPLRLEISRFGQSLATANRTSPQVMVKHLNNQANLSIPVRALQCCVVQFSALPTVAILGSMLHPLDELGLCHVQGATVLAPSLRGKHAQHVRAKLGPVDASALFRGWRDP